MKILFWNIRVMANESSRVALKRLTTTYKPDIILISEPWIDFANFPQTWLLNLDLKLFAVNNRNNNTPNLWCICKTSITPTILQSSDQHVSFTFSHNHCVFGVSAIYASTSYLHRRVLWNQLSNLHNLHSIPWCCIGDFNAICGAHEHRGATSPASLPMNEVVNWSDASNMLHLPTRGALFTWSNNRGGIRHTERRLDRALCNQAWLDACSSLSVSSLIKVNSDHFPILLDCKFDEIKIPSQFKFLKMWSINDTCKEVIESCWNL
jgi:hypothetical protein